LRIIEIASPLPEGRFKARSKSGEKRGVSENRRSEGPCDDGGSEARTFTIRGRTKTIQENSRSRRKQKERKPVRLQKESAFVGGLGKTNNLTRGAGRGILIAKRQEEIKGRGNGGCQYREVQKRKKGAPQARGRTAIIVKGATEGDSPSSLRT